MQKPELTENHKRLEAFAGTWIGEDTLHPSPFFPQGGAATTKYSGSLDLHGFFVIGNDVQEVGGRPIYLAHKVFGYDPATNEFTFYLVDSTGRNSGAAARGIWQDRRVVFEQSTPQGKVIYSYTFDENGDYYFEMQVSPDGINLHPFISGKYVRQPD